jgi:putative ABC transport system permease protein
VDELYQAMLGVERLGDEAEMFGHRAIVRGISQDVRTFTASPFIFTSIDAAIDFDRRYRADEITYVLVRCEENADPEEVASRIRREVPHVEVLTTKEFIRRTVSYWMLETGVGITVVLTAVLGLLVSVVVTSQTLFAITQENISYYAMLLAVGFSKRALASVVLCQAITIGGLGILGGTAMFYPAAKFSSRTPIPLEMTFGIYLALVGITVVSSACSCGLALRTVVRTDPAAIFRV